MNHMVIPYCAYMKRVTKRKKGTLEKAIRCRRVLYLQVAFSLFFLFHSITPCSWYAYYLYYFKMELLVRNGRKPKDQKKIYRNMACLYGCVCMCVGLRRRVYACHQISIPSFSLRYMPTTNPKRYSKIFIL